MLPVLVTGGAGYIGSHTCKELHRNGYLPIVYDNLITGHREFAQWGEFVYGDICDTQQLRHCLKIYQPLGVIHFAAFAYVGESVREPGKYFRNNVLGTLSILDAMRDEGIANIVVSSTCAVYGEPDKMPISESCLPAPINPYGASKLFMERMLADYHAAHGINWIALRYFNAAGCDPDGEIGEWHEPETHLLPRIIGALLGHYPALEVYGDDYPTPDGTCIRDYIHVKDLANAHILALEHCMQGKGNRSFNLGTGTGVSIHQLIRTAETLSHRTVPFTVKQRRPGDPSMLVADSSLSKSELGWIPQYSDLNTIISTALDWHLRCPQSLSEGKKALP